MANLYQFGGLLAALLMCASVYAGNIQVENVWTRATAPGQDAAGVDMTITSKQAATLVGVTSPAAGTTELHSMTSENGMMKMREVKSIALPAGKRVNLHDSGYHLMLNGLKAPLKAGVSVPLTLNIRVTNKRIVKIKTSAQVKPLRTTRAATKDDEHLRAP